MLKYVKLTLSMLDSKNKFYVIASAFMRVILVSFDLLGIVLVGFLITKSASNLSGETESRNNFSYLNFAEDYSIQLLAILVLASFLSKSVFSIIFMKLMANTLAKSEGNIAAKFYSKILNGSYSNLTRFSQSEIINSVTYAINYSTTQIMTIFVIILSELAMLISILVLFATINLGLTVIMGMYFLMIGMMIQKVLGSKLQSAGQNYSLSINSASTTVANSIDAFREISTLKKQLPFINKFKIDRYQYAKSMSLINYYSALPRYIVESALMVGVVGLTFFSFSDSANPESAGNLGIFLAGGLRIVASMLPLQNSFGGLKQLIGQAESFYKLRDILGIESSQILGNALNVRTQSEPERIKFKNVSFKYPNGERYAVNNLNFEIEPGELIAVIGPSGSGKSTLADLIIGLVQPTIGSIDRNADLKSTARYSYVPQSPGIIHGTIAENITLEFDKKVIDKKLLQDSIDLSHLSELISSLPLGVETDLGAQSNGLSGGQMQRIGLARALYGQPKLLVLDEATSALDAETEYAISENLDQLKGKCTTVVIAHRLTTVQGADRVFVMEDGELIGVGNFSHLASTNPLVARYIELSELNPN